MLQFVNSVNKKLDEHKLIRAEKKLLASVSGGQDSMCLILILYLLKAQIEFEFDLIWVNHFWQKSSFFTMLHISKFSRSFSSRALFWLALTETLSEQRARDCRHSATQRTHAFYRYDLCAQGHSKSDRIETVLFNLIRGAGLSGVSALHWTNNQICFSRNRFYPLFAQLLEQTHVHTTRTATLYPAVQMSCTELTDRGFPTTYPNRCRFGNHCYAYILDVSPKHSSPTSTRSSPRGILESKKRRAHARKEMSTKLTCLLHNTSQLASVCSVAQTVLLQGAETPPKLAVMTLRIEQVIDNRSISSRLVEPTQYYYYQLKRITLGTAKRQR